MDEKPLAALSKPIEKLIDVISRGIGRVYAPTEKVLHAKADAKINIIKAKARIEETELLQRAQARAIHKELEKQRNIEAICSVAIDESPSIASEIPVSQDWINTFFKHAEDVSDNDMQIIWGRILSGESSSPGSFSRRTILQLSMLEKEEAIAFNEICSFACKDQNSWKTIIFTQALNQSIEKATSIPGCIQRLVSAGLLNSQIKIQNENVSELKFSYFDEQFSLLISPTRETKNFRLPLVKPYLKLVHFSQAGQQLSKITNPEIRKSLITEIAESVNLEFELLLSTHHK